MKHLIQHDLDAQVARDVTDRALATYRARFAEYDPRIEWVSERNAKIEFRVKGLRLRGGVVVQNRAIELELDVPFFLRLFRSRAIDVIEREVRYWIGRAKAGELG